MKYTCSRQWASDPNGRSSYGERGLKFSTNEQLKQLQLSLLLWGAWIEILVIPLNENISVCRSSYGERGLKYQLEEYRLEYPNCRSSYGERGLKSL